MTLDAHPRTTLTRTQVTLAGGFKEDFITVPIISWIVFPLYSVWAIALMGLVIARRNHQPVKARSPLLMILTLLTTSFLVLSNALRFGIGRSIFPCILYTMSFSLMQPGLFMPTVLRAWRLFFVYRVSTMKQVVAAHHLRRRESGGSDDGGREGAAATTNSRASTKQQQQQQQEEGDQKQVEMGESILSEAMEVSDVGDDDSDAGDERVDDAKNASFMSFVDSPLQGGSSDGAELPEESAVIKRRKSLKRYERTQKLLRSLTIWVSTPFMLGVFAMVLVFHVIVWIASNFYNASTFFNFTQGCKLAMIQLVIAVLFIIIYLILELIMGALLLTVRDAWFMK